tara:strand:+ start:239 stop:346 length:108 start_codon:yes stop_codon:yes gene_type:complete
LEVDGWQPLAVAANRAKKAKSAAAISPAEKRFIIN